VLPPAVVPSLEVFNSAGELVPISRLPGLAGKTLTDLSFGNSSATFVVGDGSPVKFAVRDSSGAVLSQIWDGRSGQGGLVSSGSYMVQLVSGGKTGRIIVSKSFTVLKASKLSLNGHRANR